MLNFSQLTKLLRKEIMNWHTLKPYFTKLSVLIATPKRKVLVIGSALILALAIFKFLSIYQQIQMHAGFKPPPEAITSAIVKELDWQPSIELVGSLQAVQGVILSAESAGKIVNIAVESGAFVNQGDLLFQIDSSVEEGELLAAQAKLEQTKLNLKRMQDLWNKKVGSEADLTDAQANAKAMQGATDSIQAIIRRKTITAPFSGQLGIRMINLGQYVNAGDKIAPLYSTDKLYLNFNVPQNKIANIQIGQNVPFKITLFPEQEFSAQINAIDPQLDPSNRSLKVQAIYDNAQGLLKAGMFATLDLKVAVAQKLPTIPLTSISYAPYGNSVYLVEKLKDQEGQEYLGVTQHFVQIAQTRGDLAAISKGLSLGQEVATSGLFKLRPFAAVSINNDIKPSQELKPTPADT